MNEHMQALADRFNAAADRLEKAGKIKTRWVPFTDPLTVLAVLLLVREASGDNGAYARTRKGGPPSVQPWAVYSIAHDWNRSNYGPISGGATEIEALITALEDLAEETP